MRYVLAVVGLVGLLFYAVPTVSKAHDAGATSSTGAVQVDGDSAGARAAQFAIEQVGKPYKWGGTGSGGFDCSGLTLGAWQQVGVNVPRISVQQQHWAQSVSRDNLRVGDLVFSNYSNRNGAGNADHVAIYVGNDTVVTASGGRGEVVFRSLSVKGSIIGYGRPA